MWPRRSLVLSLHARSQCTFNLPGTVEAAPAKKRDHTTAKKRDLTTACSSRSRQPPADLLFVLHDAGESLAVRRAVESLAHDGTLNIAVLALGEPAHSLFDAMANISVSTLKQIGISTRVSDGARRNATLSEIEVALLLAHFGRPSVVVTGMAYATQAQCVSGGILTVHSACQSDLQSWSLSVRCCATYESRSHRISAAFRSSAPSHRKECYAVGVDDGIAIEWQPHGALLSDFLDMTRLAVDELFVADEATLRNASAYSQRALGGDVTVTRTGSGTLDAWREAAANETQRAQTRALMVRAAPTRPVCPATPWKPVHFSSHARGRPQMRGRPPEWQHADLVVFSGGYDEPTMWRPFACFAVRCASYARRPPTLALSSPHIPAHSLQPSKRNFSVNGAASATEAT